MEDDLDEIAGGRQQRVPWLHQFWFGNGDPGPEGAQGQGARRGRRRGDQHDPPRRRRQRRADRRPQRPLRRRTSSGARTPRRCPRTCPLDELTIDTRRGDPRRAPKGGEPLGDRSRDRAARVRQERPLRPLRAARRRRHPAAGREAQDVVAVPDDVAVDDHARRGAPAAAAPPHRRRPPGGRRRDHRRQRPLRAVPQVGRRDPQPRHRGAAPHGHRRRGGAGSSPSRRSSGAARPPRRRRCKELGQRPGLREADGGEGRPLRALRHRRRDQRQPPQGRHRREHHRSSGRPSCCRSGASRRRRRRSARRRPPRRRRPRRRPRRPPRRRRRRRRRPRRPPTRADAAGGAPDRGPPPRPTPNVDPMAEQRQVPLPGLEDVGHDAPTEPAHRGAARPGDKPGLHVRLFGSSQFFHLWLTQVASATGDWLGFLAIAALAADIAAGLAGGRRRRRDVGAHRAGLLPRAGGRRHRRPVRPQAAHGHLRPRPGRRARHPALRRHRVSAWWWRRSCSSASRCCGRRPRRRRSRNLVPPDHLTTANSLSLIAAYGTMPDRGGPVLPASPGSATRSGNLDALDGLRTNQEGIAFYVDAATFLLSAFMISRLRLPKHNRTPLRGRSAGSTSARRSTSSRRAGRTSSSTRSCGRSTSASRPGSSAAGCSSPSGRCSRDEVLNAGTAGFGLFIFALGLRRGRRRRAAVRVPAPHPQGAGVHGVAVRRRGIR